MRGCEYSRKEKCCGEGFFSVVTCCTVGTPRRKRPHITFVRLRWKYQPSPATTQYFLSNGKRPVQGKDRPWRWEDTILGKRSMRLEQYSCYKCKHTGEVPGLNALFGVLLCSRPLVWRLGGWSAYSQLSGRRTASFPINSSSVFYSYVQYDSTESIVLCNVLRPFKWRSSSPLPVPSQTIMLAA